MKVDRNGLPPSAWMIAALRAAAEQFCEVAGIELSTLGRWIINDPNIGSRFQGNMRFSTYEKIRAWLAKYKATPNMRGRRPDQTTEDA